MRVIIFSYTGIHVFCTEGYDVGPVKNVTDRDCKIDSCLSDRVIAIVHSLCKFHQEKLPPPCYAAVTKSTADECIPLIWGSFNGGSRFSVYVPCVVVLASILSIKKVGCVVCYIKRLFINTASLQLPFCGTLWPFSKLWNMARMRSMCDVVANTVLLHNITLQ